MQRRADGGKRGRVRNGMRQQPNFYRLDRSGAGGVGRGERSPDGAPSMMVPLPPGWLCLQDCNVSGQLNQPVVVPFVLMHPDIGVAMIDIAPVQNPEAEQILRRRLDAARFESIFPGFLPILHLRLDRADLPATEAILRDAFAAMPPLSLPGGDGWISVVRRALLPRDPSRAAAHPGFPGEQARRPPREAAAGPVQEPNTDPDMLQREATVARAAAKPSFEEAVSPVPAARPTGALPWLILSCVGGLIAMLALFSLLDTGPSGPPIAAEEANDVPAASEPARIAAAPTSPARTPVPDPAVSPKPPAAPAAAPPMPAPAAAAPPLAASPPMSTGASTPPAPAQRPAPPPAAAPAAAATDRSPRVTVRQPANLRTGPDSQSNIVRVVPRGETLRVHGRTANGWVQVGDAEPRGWLHTSRLGEIEQ